LVGRQEGHLACKKLSGERCADLHMAQLTPLPLTVSCFSKIQIGSTFLVPAHLGSPEQRVVKRVCVCVPGEPWLNNVPSKALTPFLRQYQKPLYITGAGISLALCITKTTVSEHRRRTSGFTDWERL